MALIADGHPLRARISGVFTFAMMALSALTLVQYVAGVDLGIDQLLVLDSGRNTPYPGRIPLMGCVNFMMLGVALWLVDSRGFDGRGLAQLLALGVCVMAFVMLLGFAYEIRRCTCPTAAVL